VGGVNKRLLACLLIPGAAWLSCVSASNVPNELGTVIPDGSNCVAIHSTASPDTLYRAVYRALAADGFSIESHEAEMGTLTTGYKDVGQYTVLRINVFIDSSPGGSVAYLRGQWAVTTSFATAMGSGGATAEEAVWGKTGRPSVAFGEMANFAEKVTHVRIDYITKH
jgi:hypothetical protein